MISTRSKLALILPAFLSLAACGDDPESRNAAIEAQQAQRAEAIAAMAEASHETASASATDGGEPTAADPSNDTGDGDKQPTVVDALPSDLIEDAQGFDTMPADDAAGFDPSPAAPEEFAD